MSKPPGVPAPTAANVPRRCIWRGHPVSVRLNNLLLWRFDGNVDAILQATPQQLSRIRQLGRITLAELTQLRDQMAQDVAEPSEPQCIARALDALEPLLPQPGAALRARNFQTLAQLGEWFHEQSRLRLTPEGVGQREMAREILQRYEQRNQGLGKIIEAEEPKPSDHGEPWFERILRKGGFVVEPAFFALSTVDVARRLAAVGLYPSPEKAIHACRRYYRLCAGQVAERMKLKFPNDKIARWVLSRNLQTREEIAKLQPTQVRMVTSASTRTVATAKKWLASLQKKLQIQPETAPDKPEASDWRFWLERAGVRTPADWRSLPMERQLVLVGKATTKDVREILLWARCEGLPVQEYFNLHSAQDCRDLWPAMASTIRRHLVSLASSRTTSLAEEYLNTRQTLEQVAAKTRLTRERVRQIAVKAVKQLLLTDEMLLVAAETFVYALRQGWIFPGPEQLAHLIGPDDDCYLVLKWLGTIYDGVDCFGRKDNTASRRMLPAWFSARTKQAQIEGTCQPAVPWTEIAQKCDSLQSVAGITQCVLQDPRYHVEAVESSVITFRIRFEPKKLRSKQHQDALREAALRNRGVLTLSEATRIAGRQAARQSFIRTIAPVLVYAGNKHLVLRDTLPPLEEQQAIVRAVGNYMQGLPSGALVNLGNIPLPNHPDLPTAKLCLLCREHYPLLAATTLRPRHNWQLQRLGVNPRARRAPRAPVHAPAKAHQVRQVLEKLGRPATYEELAGVWAQDCPGLGLPPHHSLRSNYVGRDSGIIAWIGGKYCTLATLPISAERRERLAAQLVEAAIAHGKPRFGYADMQAWFPGEVAFFSRPLARAIANTSPRLRPRGVHYMELRAEP